MKDRTPEQLKGQIRAFASKRNLQPQEVLQMFMFERVLDRLARSKYAKNFILKGGLLISSMFGIEERTTLDMDTTVTGINLEEGEIKRIINEILAIDIGDGIRFEFSRIEPIRDSDEYNDYRVYFIAHYGKIANEMKMDITTGDIITPSAIDYKYRTILDGDEIHVKAYNKETIIAEKYETIIRRNIGSTRARDFYDLHMFYNLYMNEIDIDTLRSAVEKTSRKRGSENELADWDEICEDMKQDAELIKLWDNYISNNPYSQGVTFEDVMKAVEEVGKRLK
ncbi:MAG: nucleotidyl transferase AbiEii/AbiGii toxin family protein [Lachnospiraceae bacterium]|nr:nucleotidyl transferase AbiEii/AbiGii toxin family protein [Lachnospiraceae bacterium]